MRAMREEMRILKAMCNPVRLAIIEALLDGEKSVSELVLYTGRMQPAVSMQLAKLEFLGIVESRREGVRVYYRLINDKVRKILKILKEG